jgi:hypothetical protein
MRGTASGRFYSYVIAYRDQTKPLEIIAIVHGARQLDASFSAGMAGRLPRLNEPGAFPAPAAPDWPVPLVLQHKSFIRVSRLIFVHHHPSMATRECEW